MGLLLFLLLIALVARAIEASMEVDDLKSQVRLQKEAIAFLEAVDDHSLSSCALKVPDLETVVVAKGIYSPVAWNGDNSLVGPYRVKKRSECVIEVKLVGLP